MKIITSRLGKLFAAVLMSLTIATGAFAQVLVVDDQRVERESLAWKDFRLQTTVYSDRRQQMVELLDQGGLYDQEEVRLKEKLSIIGQEKFDEEVKKLQLQRQQATYSYQILGATLQQLRREAAVQIERARGPVIRQILKDRNAQVILPKSLVLGSAAGLDVTTEFIELLDAQVSTVTLSIPAQGDKKEAAADGEVPVSE